MCSTNTAVDGDKQKKAYPAAVSRSCAGKNKHANEQLHHIQPSSISQVCKGGLIVFEEISSQKKSWKLFIGLNPHKSQVTFVHRSSVVILIFRSRQLLRGVANPNPVLTAPRW